MAEFLKGDEIMKKHHRWFIAGIVFTLIVSTLISTAFAAYQKQATLNYSGISITLDGKKITPKDANGNTVEPFTISGTTYLPVRAIATALGLNVTWDGNTQTVGLYTGAVPQTPAQPTQPQKWYKDGNYKVGTDIPAGTYYIECTSDWSAYFCVSSDSNGKNILENEIFDTHTFITISNGQYLEISRGKATLASYVSDLVAGSSFGEGMYRVGTDIEAGEYKLTSTDDTWAGYYCIYDNVSAGRDIVANKNFTGNAYVTVKNGQYLELVRCKADK